MYTVLFLTRLCHTVLCTLILFTAYYCINSLLCSRHPSIRRFHDPIPWVRLGVKRRYRTIWLDWHLAGTCASRSQLSRVLHKTYK